MSDSKKLLASLEDLATKMLALVDPKKGEAATAALGALRRLIEDARSLGRAPADIATLDALQQKVSAHAAETAARLRGAA